MVQKTNRFSEQIPSELGLLKLVELRLDDNPITGNIPKEIWHITSLRKLGFANTDLSPQRLPSEIGLLTNLSKLIARNTRMTGPLPVEIGRLTSFKELDLRDTELTGTVPLALCTTKELFFDCSDFLCGCDCPCNAK